MRTFTVKFFINQRRLFLLGGGGGGTSSPPIEIVNRKIDLTKHFLRFLFETKICVTPRICIAAYKDFENSLLIIYNTFKFKTLHLFQMLLSCHCCATLMNTLVLARMKRFKSIMFKDHSDFTLNSLTNIGGFPSLLLSLTIPPLLFLSHSFNLPVHFFDHKLLQPPKMYSLSPPLSHSPLSPLSQNCARKRGRRHLCSNFSYDLNDERR